MFAFDRDTATLVAVVVCVAATVYLFRELKRTREELTSAIAEKQQPVIYMEPPPPPVAAAPVPEPTPEPAPAVKPTTTRGKKQVTIAEPEVEK